MRLGTEVGLGPDDIVFDVNPAHPLKSTVPQFSAHDCCGETAICIRIPRCTKVGLSLGDVVLDGTQLPFTEGAQPPNFQPMFVVAKRLNGLRYHLVCRYRPRP